LGRIILDWILVNPFIIMRPIRSNSSALLLEEHVVKENDSGQKKCSLFLWGSFWEVAYEVIGITDCRSTAALSMLLEDTHVGSSIINDPEFSVLALITWCPLTANTALAAVSHNAEQLVLLSINDL